MGLRMVATLAVLMLIGCGDAVDQPDDETIGTTVATLEETPADTAGTTPQVSDTVTSPPTGTGSPASEAPTELRVGDQGPKVEALQRQLVRLGFTIDADGHFGPATEAAVRSVQFTHGLTVDGIAGPRTTAVIDAAEPGATLILAADGVGAVEFGDHAAGALPALTNGLGEPAEDLTGRMDYPCGDTTCAGRERVVAWTGPVARFSVRFDDTGNGLLFTGWELTGTPSGGIDLATEKGIRLGSSGMRVQTAYPDTVFGFYPEPGCGDTWWSPGEFRIGGEAAYALDWTGLRGWLGVFDDNARAAVHQAMIDHGHPSGIDCAQDVMCAEVFGEIQESVGLPHTGGLDRATWLALGLPLPLDSDAPVEQLRAGALITGC
jgi:peptidoglycan hydrolase-like protein with peptidoglycan-binding domain